MKDELSQNKIYRQAMEIYMIDPIFPRKEDEQMSDRDWETYCCLVWCCNSLNAHAHVLKHRGDNTGALYMRRAQDVITFLLEESGRLEHWRL